MLPYLFAVATGSWLLKIELCETEDKRRPRPYLGCSAIGWMNGWKDGLSYLLPATFMLKNCAGTKNNLEYSMTSLCRIKGGFNKI
jgi:hypothetical protein